MKEKNFSPPRTSLPQKIALVLLGLILSLVFLEVGMRLGGFVLLSIQEYGNLRSIKQKGTYRILCLGESTTQGEYPRSLEQILNQRNTGVRFSVIDEGRIATNTMAILGEVETYLAEYHPDMVIAMMGINDEGVKYYQDVSESETWFFKHCRIYRFGRMLFMRVLKKIGQEDIFRFNKSDPDERTKPEDTRTVVKKAVLAEDISTKKVVKPSPESRRENQGPGPGLAGARKLSEKDAELASKNVNSNMEQGWLYLNQDKFSQAEDCFRKVIELYLDDTSVASAYFGLGRLYRKQGKSFEAKDSFKKALELDPKNDNTYIELGWLHQGQGEFAQAEDSFKKALELDPKSDKPCVGLGTVYQAQGKSPQAEDFFQRAIKLNPKNEHTYAGLGWLYQAQSKFSQSEDAFKKTIELNPKYANAYLGLGMVYLHQNKFAQAEDAFKRTIELNPKDAGSDSAYFGLGRVYRLQNKLSQYEDLFRKTIQLNPKSDSAYFDLGGFYADRGKFAEAEAAFRSVIEFVPKSERTYLELGELYRKQGKFSQAEDSLKKVLEINPKNERALGAMASLCEEMGKPEPVKEYAQRANQVRLEDHVEATVGNYRKLKKILDRKRIKLVCVQYPMRNVEPLKRIFAEDKGVIFVDNEDLFKEAVKKEGYEEYFRDMFAGDFGHCTPKGNELLAKNIADVILREVFSK